MTAQSALSSVAPTSPLPSASTKAVIVTVPSATPVTLPLATVAFVVSDDFQENLAVVFVGVSVAFN